jgi:ATP-dependent RNA helicase DDX52/ROK1
MSIADFNIIYVCLLYINFKWVSGRAGRKGNAVTFFTEKDIPLMRPIANVVKISGCEVPDWMLTIKPVSVPHLKIKKFLGTCIN